MAASTSKRGSPDSKDGDQSYIRFGFKGETQINVQLTGYGRWEAEFAGKSETRFLLCSITLRFIH